MSDYELDAFLEAQATGEGMPERAFRQHECRTYPCSFCGSGYDDNPANWDRRQDMP